MELEEFKNTWKALDNRMEYSERLSAALWKDRIQRKGIRSNRKLFYCELFGMIVLLGLIPFIAYCLEIWGGRYFFWDMTVYLSGAYSIGLLVWTLFKLYGLIQIDFSGSIKHNIYCINQYNLRIRREKIAMCLIFPILAIMAILTYAQLKASISLWILMVCSLILATLFMYWSYKKFFPDQIRSMIQSLEELKEVEED